jgi:hypothetical protein
MYVYGEDIFYLFRLASRNVAKKLGVEGVDFKSIDELMQDIESRDKETHELLKDFFDAYKNWVNFDSKIEKQGKREYLTETEKEELKQLTEKLNRTRTKLIQKVS